MMNGKLLERAMAILAKRDHSGVELRRKLAAPPTFKRYQKRRCYDENDDATEASVFMQSSSPTYEISPQEIEAVIEYCQQHHWLDDKRFAENLLKSRSRKGYGPRRIQMELQQKGVESSVIDYVLAESEINWLELANAEIDKKFGKQDLADWKIKSKAYNYLSYKGYYSEEINEALNKRN